MVKIVSPLHSYSAHGKLGDVVYTGRFARQYVLPTQANTEAQGNIRQAFKAIQQVTNHLTGQIRKDLRALWGARWSAILAAEVLGKNLATWTQTATSYQAYIPAAKEDWDAIATNFNITSTAIPYASDPPCSPGFALFAVAASISTTGYCPMPTADNQPDVALALFG